jgi:hydrogen cyanide synthase HcnB
VKTQGILPGKRVLITGTGPLLLVLAEALLKAGGRVAAVVDSSKSSWALKYLPGLVGVPSLCIEALRLQSILRKNKVPLYRGWGIVEARGEGGVSEILCAPLTGEGIPDRSRTQRFEPDVVAVGYGLLSRTAVVRLLGAKMYYDSLVKDYIPRRDENLETSVQGVFAVGDGARVAGKLVAREEGALAGLAAARRLGKLSDGDFSSRSKQIRSRLRRFYRFRRAVDELYRLPKGIFHPPSDDTIICRCEEVTAGEIREAAREGTLNLNDIKRRVRAGHGWCQGRTCSPAIVEMLAHEQGVSQEQIFRMTPRAPSKPIPLSMLIQE